MDTGKQRAKRLQMTLLTGSTRNQEQPVLIEEISFSKNFAPERTKTPDFGSRNNNINDVFVVVWSDRKGGSATKYRKYGYGEDH